MGCDCKTMKDVSEVKSINGGVRVEITDSSVEKRHIEEVVDNCKTGKCDCMTDDMKQKVASLEVKDDNGKIAIEIKGDIEAADINEAMGRSQKRF